MKSISFFFTKHLFVAFLLVAFVACSSDDNTPNEPDPEAPTPPEEPDTSNKTSGFVVVGTNASETDIAKYVEELPETGGAIDLSVGGQDYPNFFPTSVLPGVLFMARPDQGAGFSKFVVDFEGNLVEDGVLPTVDASSFRIAARDAQIGVFQDRNTPDIISIFNPTTLEVTGNIDMSEGFVPGDVDQRYQRFIFRGDDVFAAVRENGGASFTSLVVHQANVATESFVGDTQRDGDGVNTIITRNTFFIDLTDDAGNLYLNDGGNYDGAGIPGRINKIPAGSNEIDPTYTFEPAVTLNPANTFLPTFGNLNLLEGSKAIALVNAETPQEAIAIVVAAGGVQNLTPDQIQEVLGLLFSSPTARWCSLDLDAQTVTPIEGIPSVSAFAGGNVFLSKGDVYLPVATVTENSYYKWEGNATSAEKAFDIIGGAISGVYNLSIDD